jgi:diguanylate cyclase (GGDEF)-like protein/PAS domain S-box-containing protein
MKRRRIFLALAVYTTVVASFGVIILLNSISTALFINLAVLGLLILVSDVALYRSYCSRVAEKSLRSSEERYALATQGANEGIWDWDLHKNRLYFSSQWKTCLGYQEVEIISDPKEWTRLMHPDDVKRFNQDLKDHLEGRKPQFCNEHRMKRKDGDFAWVYCRGAAIFRRKKPYRILGSLTDITQRKKKEEELIYQASHDILTGLPNRSALMTRLNSRMSQPQGPKEGPCALLMLDMDGFKEVNDRFGHHTGDQLLNQLARRLELCVRAKDMVTRLGGDEFAILLDNLHLTGKAETVQLAGRILQHVEKPFEVNGHNFTLSASIGIAIQAGQYQAPDEWMNAADEALYRAKSKGKARFEFFTTLTGQPALNTQVNANYPATILV